MHRRLVLAVCLGLAAAGGLAIRGAQGEKPAAGPAGAPLDAWIPDAALAVLEITQPGPVLDRLLEAVRLAREAVPANGKPSVLHPGPGWTNMVRFLEVRFNTTGETLARRLVRDGAVVAVGPGGASVVIARSGDEAFLQDLHAALAGAAEQAAQRRQRPSPVEKGEHAGVTYWTIDGGKEYHAIVGGTLIFANKLVALQAVLDLQSGMSGASVAALPGYRAARARVADDAAARLVIAPEVLKFLRPRPEASGASPHPMAELLLAGYRDAFRGEGWLALGVKARDRALSLALAPAGAPPTRDAAASFAWPADAADGVLAVPPVPRQIASATLYRDLRAFYAAKDTLFPERTSQLIFFENMMGIYFSGRDLTDDVMGAVDPHLRLVVAEQSFDPAIGTPAVQVPAFALVFRMRDPKRFAPIAEEAWQKALGMVNFTRGQKAEPGLIIDRLEHGGIRYTCAAFSAAEERDRAHLDVRFNFRPSIAFAGEYMILSSSDGLVNDLIDALKAHPAAPVAGLNSLVDIDGRKLAAALELNREFLIQKNMLEKGREREQAAQGLDTVLGILRNLGRATLRAGAPGGKVQLELTLDTAAPAAASAR